MARGDVEILAPGEEPSPSQEGVEEAFQRLDRLARLLDTVFVIPGTNIRFGVDALIGLVPGIGDIITTAISSWLIFEARRLGISRLALARMIANTTVDGVIGAIPILGDAFDVAFRANRRNIAILREQLARRRTR